MNVLISNYDPLDSLQLRLCYIHTKLYHYNVRAITFRINNSASYFSTLHYVRKISDKTQYVMYLLEDRKEMFKVFLILITAYQFMRI